MHVPTGPNRPRFRFSPSQVLVLGFAALIFLGAFILWLPISSEPGKSISFLDAIFTATSAVCVTGLVVVDTATQFSTFGEVSVIALIQAGGLGIMTLSALMLLLMGRRISLGERLLMQEALGSFSIAGVVRLTKNIILTTFAIEAIGGLILSLHWLRLFPAGKSFYMGFWHSISAFNNAGFDLTSESLRPFQRDPITLFVIGSLIILGGIGFFVMEDVWRNRAWAKLSLHSRVAIKMTLILIAVGTLLFLGLEATNPDTWANLPWYHQISNAWFAAVTPRTAGFESVVTPALRDVSLLLTIMLMFVGASPGGTGGGIKTTTFTMIALTVRSIAKGKEQVTIMGRRLPKDLVEKAVAITAIAMTLVVGVTGLLLITERAAIEDPNSPITFLHVLLETVSAFGTVGLTSGLSAVLTSAGKILLALMMFIGRVGPLTMAVALAKRAAERDPIQFPEDRVMIG